MSLPKLILVTGATGCARGQFVSRLPKSPQIDFDEDQRDIEEADIIKSAEQFSADFHHQKRRPDAC